MMYLKQIKSIGMIFLPLFIYMIIQEFMAELFYGPYGIAGSFQGAEIPGLLGTFAGAVTAFLIFFREAVKTGRIKFEKTGKLKKTGKHIWLLAGLAVSICMTGNMLMSLLQLEKLGSSYQEARQVIYSGPVWLQLLCIGAAAPAAEEMVFRLYGFQEMRRFMGFLPSAVFSALYFGAYHGNVVQGIYGCFAGFFLAYVMERYQTAAAPVLFHMIINICSLILTWKLGGRTLEEAVMKTILVVFSGLAILFIYLIEKNSGKREETR